MKLVYNDSSHSYWLNGKRVKSASKVAGIAADSFTIEQWQKRQVAIGMTLDKTLAERVAVDLDNREAIQQVCEDAANAAKANARAHRGTQRHRVFELGLLGRQDQFITDQQVADWKVLERTLDAYGLEPMPDRIEQFVAWPDYGVVGRYDAYLKYRSVPSIVDLKGGENAVKYPHSTAVQMWLYRFAPHTSKTIKRDGDKSEVTEWTTAPDGADPDVGYVIYCDDHHDVGELWRMDLAAARRGGELALQIVEWRKAYNYGKELACPIATTSSTQEETSGSASSTNQPSPTSTTPTEPKNSGGSAGSSSTSSPDKSERHGSETTTSSTSTTYSYEQHTGSTTADRRSALLARYQAMSDAEKLAYTDLGVDPNDLDAVEAGLDKVDLFNIVVLHAPVGYAAIKEPPPPPDEGGTVAQADVDALHQRFEALPLDAKLWTGQLVAQGNRGWSFRIKDVPTVRRFELYRGILALAEWAFPEEGRAA